jgi:hypothetical protein
VKVILKFIYIFIYIYIYDRINDQLYYINYKNLQDCSTWIHRKCDPILDAVLFREFS